MFPFPKNCSLFKDKREVRFVKGGFTIYVAILKISEIKKEILFKEGGKCIWSRGYLILRMGPEMFTALFFVGVVLLKKNYGPFFPPQLICRN